VIGGCGYIGSHTITKLIRSNKFRVISIDSFINSSAEALDNVAAITGVKVENFAVDLCDKTATEKVFNQYPDIAGVIHFAALKSVPESVANPLLYYRNNINSLANLLDICEARGVKNFIFSSSCSIYGNVTELPVSEETRAEKAESPYAYTKQIGEQMLKDFVKISALQCIALRYFNPVGADETGLNGESPINPPTALVPIITLTAAGKRSHIQVFGNDYDTRDGSCIRDYIHVTDIADAHIKALEYLIEKRNQDSFEVFNLGTGNGVTVLEAINAFEQNTGLKLNYNIVPRREGDVAAIYSNSAKAKKYLGWETKRDIGEMMRTAWAWQKKS
jgi:UDP-glucose 4-epimerase